MALARRREFKAFGTANLGDQGLREVTAEEPDVVLIDTSLPEGQYDVLRLIGEISQTSDVVALALPETNEKVVACAEAGIAGYVPPSGSLDDLVRLVLGVTKGELTCSPRVARFLLDRVNERAGSESATIGPVDLTPREREILELAGQGLSNKEIAEVLHIAVSTVKNHIHQILKKMHLHRRSEIAALIHTTKEPGLGRIDQKI